MIHAILAIAGHDPRHLANLLAICTEYGWTATTICHTVPDVAAVLASGHATAVAAVTAPPGLAAAVAAAGGRLEVARRHPTTPGPAGIAEAVASLVVAGRLSAADAAAIIAAAGPPPDDGSQPQRRPRRTTC